MQYLDSMKKKLSEVLLCFQSSLLSVTLFFLKILKCYKFLPFLTACLIQAWKVCCNADKHGFFYVISFLFLISMSVL